MNKYSKQEQSSATAYDFIYERGLIEGWNNAVPSFVEAYKKELQSDPDRRVLDLGCGQGRNTVFLAQQGFDTYGIDVSENGLNLAKSELGSKGLKAKLQKGTLFNLPYQNSSFKAVFSNSSLQSLDGPEGAAAAFAESSRVLKTNGIFFVYINADPLVESLRGLPNALGNHYYSEAFLQHLAHVNNFNIESINAEIVKDPKTETDLKMWKVVFRKIS